MESKNPRQPSPWEYAAAFLTLAALTIYALLCASCSPRIVERIEYRTDTLRVVRVDSVWNYERDSVYVKEKGDTIWQYVERIRYRDRVKIDTFYKVRIDSVSVAVPVEIEKPLPAWRKFQIRAFWGLCVALLLALLWIFRKSLLKLIKI